MDWDDRGMHGFGNSQYSSATHLLGMLLLFAFIGLVAWLAFRVLDRPSGKSGSRKASGDSPLEILDRRLAMGEVSKDDYIVAKELLQKKD